MPSLRDDINGDCLRTVSRRTDFEDDRGGRTDVLKRAVRWQRSHLVLYTRIITICREFGTTRFTDEEEGNKQTSRARPPFMVEDRTCADVHCTLPLSFDASCTRPGGVDISKGSPGTASRTRPTLCQLYTSIPCSTVFVGPWAISRTVEDSYNSTRQTSWS